MQRRRNIPTTCERRSRRSGAAAVECALVAPLLVLVVLSAIDVGQFVNVSQVVDNAAREGARKAVRDTTTDVSQVEAAVKNYLSLYFPDMTLAEIDSATTVTVQTPDEPDDGNTTPETVTGSALGSVASGTELTVEVKFQFDSVRWLNGVPSLDGLQLKTRAVMRRE